MAWSIPTVSAAALYWVEHPFSEQLGLGLGGWSPKRWAEVYLRHLVLCCPGWCVFCVTIRLVIGRLDF